MSPPPTQPLFLARETYRKRRVMDAARLLPVAGAFLIAIPVLWVTPEDPAADTAREAVYIFLVWTALVAGAYLLSRRLMLAVEEGGAGDGGAEGDAALEPEPPAAAASPQSRAEAAQAGDREHR